MKGKMKVLEAGARKVAGRAGREVARRAAELGDEMLVEAGKAAAKRQRGRAVTRALKTAAKVVAVAGASAAAIVVARAAARRRKSKKS